MRKATKHDHSPNVHCDLGGKPVYHARSSLVRCQVWIGRSDFLVVRETIQVEELKSQPQTSTKLIAKHWCRKDICSTSMQIYQWQDDCALHASDQPGCFIVRRGRHNSGVSTL